MEHLRDNQESQQKIRVSNTTLEAILQNIENMKELQGTDMEIFDSKSGPRVLFLKFGTNKRLLEVRIRKFGSQEMTSEAFLRN